MTLHTPFWWAEAGAPLAYDQTTPPSHTDYLIVGGGHTGASAARILAKAGKSVLILDAHAPGHAASSRNGGMVGGGHRQSLAHLQKQYGDTVAIALLREAHKDSGQFVKDLIATENIACHYSETGRFRGFLNSKQYEDTAQSIQNLQQHFTLNAQMIPMAQQHNETPSTLYRGGVVFHDHAGFQPALFHRGLLAAAERAGAKICGHCAVNKITPHKGHFLVQTHKGTVQADQVLVATNGYTDQTAAPLHKGIFPIPSFIVATEPLPKDTMRALFPKMRMMVETRARHCYYRPSPDGTRIILGGRAALTQRNAAFTQSQLEKLLHGIYPELGHVGIDYHWRGNTGFSFDQMPHIGQTNGLWYAMGYSGNGNTMAPYLGHKVALQMLNDPEGDTAYSHTPLPQPWWYHGKPWFMQILDPLYRVLDWKEKLF